MEMTINLDIGSYGDEATEEAAAAGAQWMRDVAAGLGMRLVETWREGTDDAQEIWADDDDVSTDIGERVFELWCEGVTVADAASRSFM